MLIDSAVVGLGYLIGSIPSGAWIARLRGIVDITQHGSGNIGATNVARTLGIKYFFIVFLLDCFKAFSYLFFLQYVNVTPITQTIAAGALLLGNGYSIFLLGRGGKGIATSVGILLALQPPVFIAFASVWLLTLWFTRTIGIASVTALSTVPWISFYFDYTNWYLIMLTIFMGIWGIYRHGQNVTRFIKKELRTH